MWYPEAPLLGSKGIQKQCNRTKTAGVLASATDKAFSEKKGDTQARFPFLATTYVSPAHVPPERALKKQQPNTQCVIINYPYAQFKAHLDVNTNGASHSNRGERKIVNPTSWIDYDTVYFSFPHLGMMNDVHDCLPSNVLDAISLEESIDWMG